MKAPIEDSILRSLHLEKIDNDAPAAINLDALINVNQAVPAEWEGFKAWCNEFNINRVSELKIAPRRIQILLQDRCLRKTIV